LEAEKMNKIYKLLAACVVVLMVSNIINVRLSAEKPAKKMLHLDRETRNYLHSIEKAGIGDIQYNSPTATTLSTATVNTAISDDGLHLQYVKVKIQDSDAAPHLWASTSITVSVTSDTSSGSVAVTSPLTFTAGVGYAKITRTGSWANGERTTLTINAMTLFHTEAASVTQLDIMTD